VRIVGVLINRIIRNTAKGIQRDRRYAYALWQ
jgi:hypothetical protein